eukprot:s554_g32.t1
MSVPALNKWTTVSPCLNLIAAAQHFCNVLPEAMGRCFPPEQDVSSESEDEGQPLGVPLDQTKVWRKLARKRQKKSAQFMQDRDSQWLTLLWAMCAAPVMSIHYVLFKRGTFLNERPQEPEKDWITTLVLSNRAMNPATRAMSELTSMILDTVRVPAWQPLSGFYGPVLNWPQARLRTARRTLLTEMGQLWRKLMAPWDKYPWKLVELPLMDEEHQKDFASAFFSQPSCCLDAFSAKLKNIVGSEAGLLRTETLLFLKEVFDRVVPTSTFIERAFARLNRWCDRKGPKPQLSTLAAKHSTYHFRAITDRWRKDRQKAGLIVKKTNRSRPAWAHGVRKGRAKNGLHIFAREVGLRPNQGLMTQWSRLSPEERQRYSSLARAENRQSKTVQHLGKNAIAESNAITGGFWQMSSATGFPMAQHIVRDHLQELQQLAAKFKEGSQDLQPEDPEAFAGSPHDPQPLFACCLPGRCPHLLAAEQEAFFNFFHKMLLELILRKGPGPDACSQEPLLLQFKSAHCEAEPCIVVAYHTRKKPIEVALAPLEPALPDVLGHYVFSMRLQQNSDGYIPMQGSVEFLVGLVQHATDWEVSVLQPGPIRKLCHFDIIGSEPISSQDLQNEIKKEAELKAAMQAVKRLPQKKRPATSQGRGRSRKAARQGPLASARAMLAEEEAWETGSSSSASGSSSSDTDPEAAADAPAPLVLPAAAADVPGAAADVPAPPVVPAAAIGQPDAASGQVDAATGEGHRREARPWQNLRRGHVWGTCPAFQLAPIHADGSVAATGWGAICGRHTDPSRPGLTCKKAMGNRGLTDEQCQLRLKRWLVQGLDDADWGPNKRESHVSMGGVQMCQFAEGLSSADLDAAVSHCD